MRFGPAFEHRLFAGAIRLSRDRRAALLDGGLRHVVAVILVVVLVRPAILLLGLLVVGLRREHDAEIMLGMLEIAFRHHDVAGGLRVPPELEVFVRNRLRRSADLHVRAVAFVDAAQRIAAAAGIASAAAAP